MRESIFKSSKVLFLGVFFMGAFSTSNVYASQADLNKIYCASNDGGDGVGPRKNSKPDSSQTVKKGGDGTGPRG